MTSTPLSGRIARDRITLTATPTTPEPGLSDWPHRNYEATLHRPGATQTVGNVQYDTENPDMPNVFDVLAMALSHAKTYEDWACDYDDDPDRARATYEKSGVNVASLKTFLGGDYGDYLHRTDHTS